MRIYKSIHAKLLSMWEFRSVGIDTKSVVCSVRLARSTVRSPLQTHYEDHQTPSDQRSRYQKHGQRAIVPSPASDGMGDAREPIHLSPKRSFFVLEPFESNDSKYCKLKTDWLTNQLIFFLRTRHSKLRIIPTKNMSSRPSSRKMKIAQFWEKKILW